jgi:hypothetical protein
VVWIATGVAVVGLCAWVALHPADDHHPAALRVGWAGEGRPSCTYDPKDHTVLARLLVKGVTRRPDRVTVTVTAYADENTSRPVGSATRRIRVEDTVHQRIKVTIPVTKAPHVDVDGVTACRLSARSRERGTLPLF